MLRPFNKLFKWGAMIFNASLYYSLLIKCTSIPKLDKKVKPLYRHSIEVQRTKEKSKNVSREKTRYEVKDILQINLLNQGKLEQPLVL